MNKQIVLHSYNEVEETTYTRNNMDDLEIIIFSERSQKQKAIYCGKGKSIETEKRSVVTSGISVRAGSRLPSCWKELFRVTEIFNILIAVVLM